MKSASSWVKRRGKKAHVASDGATLPYLPDARSYMRLFCMTTGETADKIEGSFEVHQIRRYMPYIALSHCWGQDESSMPIWVDDKPLMIRAALHEALCHLRSTKHKTKIWADQICIRQTDNDERSSQIERMDGIFSSSEMVVAWLGPATVMSDFLFSTIRTIPFWRLGTGIPKDDPSVVDVLGPFDHDGRWVRICRERSIQLSDSRYDYEQLLIALITLLQRPYFQRTWIIQECVLAPRLVFQAGGERLDSIVLTTLLNDLRDVNHSCFQNAADAIMRPSAVLELQWACSPSRGEAVPWQKMDPLAVLDLSRRRLTKDNRDRIYSLLGIVSRIDPFLKSGTKPDYGKTVKTVYMEMMVTLLNQYCSPEPLRFCCANTARRESPSHILPSWCEDWSDGSNCTKQRSRNLHRRPNIYHAADSRAFDFANDPPSHALSMKGTIIDELVAVSPHAYGIDQEYRCWTHWLNFIGAAEPFSCSQLLFRILLADHDPDSPDLARASQDFIRDRALSFSFCTDEHQEDSPNVCHMQYEAPRAVTMIDDAVNRKVLFRTRSGLFGASCLHAAVGDKVCLIDGGGLPFLVREVFPRNVDGLRRIFEKQKKLYQLIGGECYIHGLADGEMGHVNAERKDTICLV